ncbi:MAG: hypothetical protein A3G18_12585 [Rhodospirillales bacterium RIFCSPLOWO2_12_FULL_58_28]|nr:MAG: hypothetical protein A3H92_09990 [Rhodospirillales bacterium RIFCSPLOWO2_02_FULL_58_16]OHC77107.1 MAG: hypothetical protein A3G18_12585 [Rhodospirillales bacterium RIFCSPLOWO2_12_FULL_58_28]
MNRKLRRAQEKRQQTLNDALRHHREGNLRQAEAGYRRGLAGQPDNPQAHYNLGIALKQQGRPAEAAISYRQAISLNPDYAEAHNNLGGALRDLGKPEEAASAYGKAIALRPDYAEAHNNLGNALTDMGKLEDALACFYQAVALKADYAEAHYNIGNTLLKMKKPEAAADAYRRAVALKENFPDAYGNLGNAMKDQGRFEEAAAFYQKAIDLNPNNAELYHNLGFVLLELRKPGRSVAAYRRALEIDPASADAASNLIFALDFDPTSAIADHRRELERWNEINARPLAGEIKPHANSRDPERRLRIGYVSADFYSHSAAHVFGPVLLGHDPRQFQVFCYANSPREDDLTEQFRRSASQWRMINGLTDAAAAKLIREDAIDILVDLSGHSEGNRLLVFARKPAPIQVTAWGRAVGTGLEAMDYLFSDRIFIPPEEQCFYAEEIVYLPCTLGYICPDDAPPVGPLPAPANGRITFGCFNRLAKVADGALDVWGKLLSSLADAVIILKDPSLDLTVRRDVIHREFSERGVAPERVILLGKTPWRQHLEAYGRIDIGLDPFPHGGGISTLEGLWMGVPFVTLKGNKPNSRGAASIQSAVGVNGWSADTPEQYLEIAETMAGDIDALAVLRGALRQRVAQSPVGDRQIYVGAVENAYRDMWRRWCGR